MKRSDQRSPGGTPLPPPPAPTASDANPWRMTGDNRPRYGPWARAPLPLPEERAAREGRPVSPKQPSPLRLLPLLVFGGILVMVVLTALEAIQAGAPVSAIGPLLFVAAVLFIAVRSMLRRRR